MPAMNPIRPLVDSGEGGGFFLAAPGREAGCLKLSRLAEQSAP